MMRMTFETTRALLVATLAGLAAPGCSLLPKAPQGASLPAPPTGLASATQSLQFPQGPDSLPGADADGAGLGTYTGTDGGAPGADSLGTPSASRGDRSDHAVLLVHGLAVNGMTLMGMQAYLSSQGVPNVETIDLPGSGVTTTIEKCAEAVAERVREMGARGITKVDLVGHSMGGLVIREYVRARRDRSVAVPTLITVATPNHGNGTVASMLERIGAKSAISQMAANSDFLARLNGSRVPAGTRAYGLWTRSDEVVSPAESCLFPGGQNQEVDVGGLGAHMAMGFHPNSMSLVHRLLVGGPA